MKNAPHYQYSKQLDSTYLVASPGLGRVVGHEEHLLAERPELGKRFRDPVNQGVALRSHSVKRVRYDV
jgi:hypothetical protein